MQKRLWGGNLTQMSYERFASQNIENIYGNPWFPILTPDEIVTNTILVSKNKLSYLDKDKYLELDHGKINFNILLTGEPRWGKTTAANIVELETKPYLFPLNVIREASYEAKPDDLRWDDYGVFSYNIGYAINGLSEFIKHSSSPEPQVNLYERGLVDHFVFAEALTKWWGYEKEYSEYIEGFKKLFRLYLGRIDGIITCNSSADTAIARGSTTPKELLELLSDGYRNFPESLSRITTAGEINPIVTLNLDFDKLEEPVQTLKRSIYTMFYWNLNDKVHANV